MDDQILIGVQRRLRALEQNATHYRIAEDGTGMLTWRGGKTPVGGSGPPSQTHVVNVRSHGAKGDGSSDDTSAIDDAVADLETVQFVGLDSGPAIEGPSLYFPTGRYVYNGSVFWTSTADGTPRNVNMFGDGAGASEIVLDTGAYLIDTDESIQQLSIRDLTVNGGEGVLRSTLAGVSVLWPATVQRCNFINYTKAAFSIESSNWPYWVWEDCYFAGGGTSGDVMGIAMYDPAAAAQVIRCHFINHRIHIKSGKGGAGLHVRDTDFIPGPNPTSGARYQMWIVPDSSSAIGGTGLEIAGNKFGNEDLRAGDKHILFADEGAGSTVADRLPSVGADSTGYVMEGKIGPNLFCGNATWEAGGGTSTELIYSTTPGVYGLDFGPITLTGTNPDMLLRLRTAAAIPVHTKIGPAYGLDPRLSSATNATDGAVIDDSGNMVTPPSVASASTLTLPPWDRLVTVTGSTTITNITATGLNGDWTGRVVTLFFSSTAQVTDGGNLGLAGNFTGGAGRLLTLVCQSSSAWYEVSRSTT